MDNTAQSTPRMTAEEYFRKTAEIQQPTELLNGEIINQAAPSIQHQRISLKLAARLDAYIEENHGRCQTFAAPTDVRLDDLNVVQPDVFVTCKPENLTEKYLSGAPDFAIEILSSNRRDDLLTKMGLYQDAGVREYWIVDPKNEKTLVYFFEHSDFPSIYTFDAPIPVGIWGGALSVRISDLL